MPHSSLKNWSLECIQLKTKSMKETTRIWTQVLYFTNQWWPKNFCMLTSGCLLTLLRSKSLWKRRVLVPRSNEICAVRIPVYLSFCTTNINCTQCRTRNQPSKWFESTFGSRSRWCKYQVQLLVTNGSQKQWNTDCGECKYITPVNTTA
jgi:hypothetical protein